MPARSKQHEIDDDTLDMDLLNEVWKRETASSGRFAPQEPGEFNIRILPPTTKGLYFLKFGLHYDILLIAGGADPNRKAVACLKETLEQDCPMCRAVNGMYAEARMGDVEDKTTIKLANKCRCRPRFVMNIVNMDDPKSGVMTWEVSKSAMADFIQPMFKRWGNIVHPTEGQVLSVTYGKQEKWNIIKNVQPTGDKSEIPVKDWREKRRSLEDYVSRYIVPANTLTEWLMEPRHTSAPRPVSRPRPVAQQNLFPDDDASSDDVDEVIDRSLLEDREY